MRRPLRQRAIGRESRRAWLLCGALLVACSGTERVHELVLIPGPSPITAGDASGGSGGASSAGGGVEAGAGNGGGAAGEPPAAGASADGGGNAGQSSSGAGEPSSVAGAGGSAGTSSAGNAGEMSSGGNAGDRNGPGGSGSAGLGDAGRAGSSPASCTDFDCGGGCPPCADGKKCLDDPDCVSGACDAGTLTCVADQCSDHRQDGLETDADCGGPLCGPCRLGEHCLDSPDCLSVACDGITLRCVADQCHDHRQDGNESDNDCGGFVCDACASGQKCRNNFDCMAAHICASMPKVCR